MIGNTVARRIVQSQVLTKVPARSIYPSSSNNVIAGPPRVKISFPEKVATGIFISACIFTGPCWIMSHLEEYRGKIEQ
ncbi:unnamed protein product [Allacma fusca]|uniref:Uncharacterized protein n=1 Tax=Allacma fusca TaxID=39272 RepID=A0A8J2J780_9HEXA|nr:unnamed protein product [Allacma fusca]